MAEIIDAHHHLWRYDAKEYGWITPAMEVLQSDFLPECFGPAMHSAGIDGSIVVQARQTIEETLWLLELAHESEEISGVVGWLPLAGPEFPKLLDQFSTRPKLKGLRHVVQDEADPEFLSTAAFNRGIDALIGTGLVYDILIYAHQLPQAIEFVRRHPRQVFVLDHCGKPSIGEGAIDAWQANLHRLAEQENVACKVSGLVTQVSSGTWDLDLLRPYLDAVLEAFGPQRLMAGSDWPVCLLASTYQQWWSALHEWASPLSGGDRAEVFGGTARRIYHLDPALHKRTHPITFFHDASS